MVSQEALARTLAARSPELRGAEALLGSGAVPLSSVSFPVELGLFGPPSPPVSGRTLARTRRFCRPCRGAVPVAAIVFTGARLRRASSASPRSPSPPGDGRAVSPQSTPMPPNAPCSRGERRDRDRRGDRSRWSRPSGEFPARSRCSFACAIAPCWPCRSSWAGRTGPGHPPRRWRHRGCRARCGVLDWGFG